MLKGAFRKLAMKRRPDRNLDYPDAERISKEAGEAYADLKDPQKRAACDRFGHQAFDGNYGISLRPGNMSCGKILYPACTTSPRAFTRGLFND